MRLTGVVLIAALSVAAQVSAQSAERAAALKEEAREAVQKRAKQTQVMVDSIFSFGELGFQEFETSRYVTGILEENGFEVERGVAGIPTAWIARWGRASQSSRSEATSTASPRRPKNPGWPITIPSSRALPATGKVTTPARPST